MKNEKDLNPTNGYLMLLVIFILLIVGVLALRGLVVFAVIALFAAILMIPGFVLVNPNSSRVLLLFESIWVPLRKTAFFGSTRFIPKERFRYGQVILIVKDSR